MTHLLITTIQSPLYWEDKAANLSMLEQKIRALDKAEIVVLPEMFNTGFSMNPQQLAETMDGPTVQWMKKLAAEKRIIVTGSLAIEEGGQYYNRLVWMQPNGTYGFYDKRHRFAYGGEHEHFAAGHKRLIASVKGWRIHLLICYDLRFPVWARQSVPHSANGETHEYDVLMYVANWPERRRHAWRSLLVARAIENQCYVVGVNRIGADGQGIAHSGDTLVIDPLGEILHDSGSNEEAFTLSLSGERLQEIRQHFPFWKDADLFKLVP